MTQTPLDDIGLKSRRCGIVAAKAGLSRNAAVSMAPTSVRVIDETSEAGAGTWTATTNDDPGWRIPPDRYVIFSEPLRHRNFGAA